ncbi:hypothetical protein Slala02_40810 [Streptomyces lavendulae subsp. lavendulae]|nr:hypothetical protein Slala01_42210 [Streptomyces lavendulae subsp. lavendulae]GLX28261.1 hypothetical protein Slala02_40810 [Streptomyces lavendulae subsp. lavendulae]
MRVTRAGSAEAGPARAIVRARAARAGVATRAVRESFMGVLSFGCAMRTGSRVRPDLHYPEQPSDSYCQHGVTPAAVSNPTSGPPPP